MRIASWRESTQKEKRTMGKKISSVSLLTQRFFLVFLGKILVFGVVHAPPEANHVMRVSSMVEME